MVTLRIRDGPVGQSVRTELARDAHWAAPEHLVVETFSAIRGRHIGNKISRQRALAAVDARLARTDGLRCEVRLAVPPA